MNQRWKHMGNAVTAVAMSAAAVSCWCQSVTAGVGDASARSPHYVARKQVVPKTAEYVLPDGTIYIAGNDLVAPLLERVNAIYSAAHPGFKFKMDLISSGV